LWYSPTFDKRLIYCQLVSTHILSKDLESGGVNPNGSLVIPEADTKTDVIYILNAIKKQAQDSRTNKCMDCTSEEERAPLCDKCGYVWKSLPCPHCPYRVTKLRRILPSLLVSILVTEIDTCNLKETKPIPP
jgi:hypothetical protein